MLGVRGRGTCTERVGGTPRVCRPGTPSARVSDAGRGDGRSRIRRPIGPVPAPTRVRLPTTGDHRSGVPFAEPSAVDVVVVPAVGVQRAGLAAGPAPLAPHRCQAVGRRQELGDIVAVGAGQRHPQRDTVPLGQHVVFRARPAAVNRARGRLLGGFGRVIPLPEEREHLPLPPFAAASLLD